MAFSMLCWVTAAVALYAHSDTSLDTDRKKEEAAKIGVDLDLKADVAEEGQHLPNATARLSAILGLEASKGLGFSAGDSKRTLQKLYIAVMTTPQAHERRATVRSSWMQMRAGREGELPWTVRFFLCSDTADGQPMDGKIDDKHAADLVVVPCREGYKDGLLTKKVRASMQYFLDNVDATYDTFMKADDDAFVYVPGILERLPPLDDGEHVYFGNFYEAGQTPDRRPESGWYEPEAIFAGAYPRAAQGMGYGVDRALLEAMLVRDKAAVDARMLFNEDRAVGVWVDMEKERGADVTFVRIKGLDGYSEETSPEGHNMDAKVTDTQMYHKMDSAEMRCLAQHIRGRLRDFEDCARAGGHKPRTYSHDAGVDAGVLPDVGMREHVAFNQATLATGADQADGHPHAHARRRADGRGG